VIRSLGASQTSGPAPLTVFFSPTASYLTAPIASYVWTFGDDGSTMVSQTARHTFTTAGTYIVSLRVSDGYGFSAAGSMSITVTP
jgi:PKD repeat protein